jgi:hypothetical protein
MLARKCAVTVVAGVMMALGIGANTAIFSLGQAVMLITAGSFAATSRRAGQRKSNRNSQSIDSEL